MTTATLPVFLTPADINELALLDATFDLLHNSTDVLRAEVFRSDDDRDTLTDVPRLIVTMDAQYPSLHEVERLDYLVEQATGGAMFEQSNRSTLGLQRFYRFP